MEEDRKKSIPSNTKAKKPAGTCESCLNFAYDEEYDEYSCVRDMDFDEDDLRQLILNDFKGCPFYQFDNEYSIVNKQI